MLVTAQLGLLALLAMVAWRVTAQPKEGQVPYAAPVELWMVAGIALCAVFAIGLIAALALVVLAIVDDPRGT